jgi:hypothetical protein
MDSSQNCINNSSCARKGRPSNFWITNSLLSHPPLSAAIRRIDELVSAATQLALAVLANSNYLGRSWTPATPRTPRVKFELLQPSLQFAGKPDIQT